jgi:hypothetical protein
VFTIDSVLNNSWMNTHRVRMHQAYSGAVMAGLLIHLLWMQRVTNRAKYDGNQFNFSHCVCSVSVCLPVSFSCVVIDRVANCQ